MSNAAARAQAAAAERMAKRKTSTIPGFGGQAQPQPSQPQYAQPSQYPNYVPPQPSGHVTKEVPVVSYDIRTVVGPATG